MVRFTTAFDGGKSRYDRVIGKGIPDTSIAKTLREQLVRRALPEKSTRFLYESLVNQWLEETERAYPKNENIAAVARAIAELMKEFRKNFKSGNDVRFLATWIHSGGAVKQKKPTDTAFFWRDADYHMYVTIEWKDKWMEEDMRKFLDQVKTTLRPFSLNGHAAFINFPDRDFPTRDHEKMYFGDNWEELRRVKTLWDKDGFFKFLHGVRRPSDPDDDVSSDGRQTDRLAREQWESFGGVHSGDFSDKFEYLRAAGF